MEYYTRHFDMMWEKHIMEMINKFYRPLKKLSSEGSIQAFRMPDATLLIWSKEFSFGGLQTSFTKIKKGSCPINPVDLFNLAGIPSIPLDLPSANSRCIALIIYSLRTLGPITSITTFSSCSSKIWIGFLSLAYNSSV